MVRVEVLALRRPGACARGNTVLAVGKSIVNRSSAFDIGTAMLAHGGGGHANAGTCQVEHAEAEFVLAEIADAVNGRVPSAP